MACSSSAKKTRGRQRIVMERMQNESSLMVTFSKRRAGLLKKASEICTLCGVEALVVGFSPKDKPYSYGNHEVDALIDRYLGIQGFLQNPQSVQKHQDIVNLNNQLTHFKEMIDLQKKRCKEILEERKSIVEGPVNIFAPLETLTLAEKKDLRAALTELRDFARNYTDRLAAAKLNSGQNQNPNTTSFTNYYAPNMPQGQNPDPTPTHFPTPDTQNFGNPAPMQIVPPTFVRGHYDNPRMIHSPMGVFPAPSFATRPSGLGMQHQGNFFSSPTMPAYMPDFATPNMVQPFQVPSNPFQGQCTQTMPTNMGVTPGPDPYHYFTSLLMGDDDETPLNPPSNPPGSSPNLPSNQPGPGSSPNPPSNPRSRFGFGPGSN